MPYRRLPQTNSSRDRALSACKAKMDITDPANLPFNASKASQLTGSEAFYKGLINASNQAKYNQTMQSGVVAPLRTKARMWVNHGYQALINACLRGQFDKQTRVLYGVPVTSNAAPEMNTDEAILQTAELYNTGENARVLAGGLEISFPSLIDINTQVDDFKAAVNTQSTLKDAYDAAQEDLAAANTTTDLLILQLWNSIEAAYDTGDKPSLRRKAREWGVVYVPSKGETPSGDDYSLVGKVTSSETELPLENVALTLTNGSLGINYITDEDGMYFLQTMSSGTYDLTVELLGYTTFTTQVEIIEGEVQELNIALVPELLPPLLE